MEHMGGQQVRAWGGLSEVRGAVGPSDRAACSLHIRLERPEPAAAPAGAPSSRRDQLRAPQVPATSQIHWRRKVLAA